MEKSFSLEILTPRRKVFSGAVISLVAPAALGYLGVLANHAPLAASLTAGKVVYRTGQGEAAVLHLQGQGFLEVRRNQVTLLADGFSTA
jgi:F-type H+-transporting ATPase subunit epsilon